MRDLNISLVQCALAWEQPEDNRAQISALIDNLPGDTDLIVLPEMFTTGFSMNAVANAEDPGGPTEGWLLRTARERDCAVTGSLAVRTEQGVHNRLLFITPEDKYHYDKRHLFRMAGEHRRYLAGNRRVVVPWRGWQINLQVCYDLRFPVFSRNLGDYDLMLYVANWPSTRRAHWRQLLIARAIENQACVIGVNRIGSDANGLSYNGDSLAVRADGELLLDMKDRSGIESALLSSQALKDYRESFPFHVDRDEFSLS